MSDDGTRIYGDNLSTVASKCVFTAAKVTTSASLLLNANVKN